MNQWRISILEKTLSIGSSVALAKPELDALLADLRSNGYQTVGPRLQDESIAYKQIELIWLWRRRRSVVQYLAYPLARCGRINNPHSYFFRCTIMNNNYLLETVLERNFMTIQMSVLTN